MHLIPICPSETSLGRLIPSLRISPIKVRYLVQNVEDSFTCSTLDMLVELLLQLCFAVHLSSPHAIFQRFHQFAKACKWVSSRCHNVSTSIGIGSTTCVAWCPSPTFSPCWHQLGCRLVTRPLLFARAFTILVSVGHFGPCPFVVIMAEEDKGTSSRYKLPM